MFWGSKKSQLNFLANFSRKIGTFWQIFRKKNRQISKVWLFFQKIGTFEFGYFSLFANKLALLKLANWHFLPIFGTFWQIFRNRNWQKMKKCQTFAKKWQIFQNQKSALFFSKIFFFLFNNPHKLRAKTHHLDSSFS